jgi:glycosyltransferase involved in cell wall biosynthesis
MEGTGNGYPGSGNPDKEPDRDPYREKLGQIIKELAIEKNIVFCGFQNNPSDFVNVMDVVVHSSITPEPFGMVNLEAMYMKKPVVATNMGGPTEIFNDGEDGVLIEPGNPEILARRISALLDNPELRREIGEKAFEKIMHVFRISDTVDQVEKIYKEICPK